MMKRILWNDAPEPWDFGLQDSGSITMEGIVQLHDEIMVYLTALLIVVSWLLTSILIKDSQNKIRYKYINHGTVLELIWTISPALILIAIAFPSLRLLYLTDEVIEPAITIKIIGFFLGGLKLYILKADTMCQHFDEQVHLNKIKDTIIFGQKNNVYYNSIINTNPKNDNQIQYLYILYINIY